MKELNKVAVQHVTGGSYAEIIEDFCGFWSRR
jgi:hypothetical protein